MAENTKRYFDLKADVNRVEVNVQAVDRTIAVTGPTSVDVSDAALLFELENSPGVKEITQAEHDAARKAKAEEERKQRDAKAERERKAAERKAAKGGKTSTSTTSSREAGQ